MVGGSPIFSVTEFYVTPFDRFVPRADPEDSDVSDLFGGKIIGFNIRIPDVDDQPGVETVHQLAVPPSNEFYTPLMLMSADDFADGVLITPDGLSSDNSAVESDSWARIKATFE